MGNTSSLIFQQSQTAEDVKEIYNFNVKAFAGTHDFTWTEENINKEIKDGWSLYSVKVEKDIVAALFLKEDAKTLFTKNTPIKLDYQGNGFSHLVKEFYEEMAKNKGITKLINYCPGDNFRMISLNEGHDYTKTGNTFGENSEIVEWEKTLK